MEDDVSENINTKITEIVDLQKHAWFALKQLWANHWRVGSRKKNH
jgi:hypothetical protein